MRKLLLFVAVLLTAATSFAQVSAVPTLTSSQVSKVQDFSPGAKAAKLGDALNALANDTNNSVKLQVIAGIDGSPGPVNLIGLTDRASAIKAILSVTTATGAMATKALLAATTDYILNADGTLEIVTNQSANTLLIFYLRK